MCRYKDFFKKICLKISPLWHNISGIPALSPVILTLNWAALNHFSSRSNSINGRKIPCYRCLIHHFQLLWFENPVTEDCLRIGLGHLDFESSCSLLFSSEKALRFQYPVHNIKTCIVSLDFFMTLNKVLVNVIVPYEVTRKKKKKKDWRLILGVELMVSRTVSEWCCSLQEAWKKDFDPL